MTQSKVYKVLKASRCSCYDDVGKRGRHCFAPYQTETEMPGSADGGRGLCSRDAWSETADGVGACVHS